MTPNMPPKKRDWKKGVPHVGVFVRTADGGTIDMVNDRASSETLAFAMFIIIGLDKAPPRRTGALKGGPRYTLSLSRGICSICCFLNFSLRVTSPALSIHR